MAPTTAREQMLRILEDQPEDSSYDELLHELEEMSARAAALDLDRFLR